MLRLALRNVLRQKARTAMTLAAIICGVAALILGNGWVNDIFVQLGEALIHSRSGHLQVHTKGFFEAGTKSPEKYIIADIAQVKQDIARLEGVDMTMARLNFAGLLNNGKTDVPIVGEGVEPDKEMRLGTFVRITAGRRLTDADTFGIEVGYGVAAALKLKPGSRLTLLANTVGGALNTLDVEVVGVVQSFSNDYDARAIKIPLAAAQELLGVQGANAITIMLKQTSDTVRAARWLQPKLDPLGMEVKTWMEMNDFYQKAVDLYQRQFGVLQLIILIMVLLSVANSVNMNVFERVGEFGTMMSLGNRRSTVFRLVVTESALLGIIGCTIGVALGVVLAIIISRVGIPMPPPPHASIGYTARIHILPGALAVSFMIGLGATLLAAILPAQRVSRTPITHALRQII
jgi:putative ABC transport system permease protein